MGIISLASGNSYWRGLDYYKNNKVIKLNKIDEGEYLSIVKGTHNYNVHLNIEHPRKSTCDCPLANGKRIICKHIVATYFAVFPKEQLILKKSKIDFKRNMKRNRKKNMTK